MLAEGIDHSPSVESGLKPRLWREGFFHSLVSELIRVSGISFILLLFLFSTSLSIWVFDRGPSPTNLFGLIFGLLFLDISLCTIGIGLWELSRWTKENLQRFWKLTIPPYEASQLVMFNLSLSSKPGVWYEKLGKKEVKRPEGDVAKIVESTLYLSTYGLILIVTGMIGFFILSPGTDEITVTNTVSLIAAVISVFLGKIIGIITLGTVSIVQSKSELAIFLSIIVIPSLALAPAAKNLIRYSEILHYDVFTNKNSVVDSLWDVLIALFLSSVWVSGSAYVLYTAFSNMTL